MTGRRPVCTVCVEWVSRLRKDCTPDYLCLLQNKEESLGCKCKRQIILPWQTLPQGYNCKLQSVGESHRMQIIMRHPPTLLSYPSGCFFCKSLFLPFFSGSSGNTTDWFITSKPHKKRRCLKSPGGMLDLAALDGNLVGTRRRVAIRAGSRQAAGKRLSKD